MEQMSGAANEDDVDHGAESATEWVREWGQVTPLPMGASQVRSEDVTKRDRPDGEPHVTVIVELSLDDIADATE